MSKPPKPLTVDDLSRDELLALVRRLVLRPPAYDLVMVRRETLTRQWEDATRRRNDADKATDDALSAYLAIDPNNRLRRSRAYADYTAKEVAAQAASGAAERAYARLRKMDKAWDAALDEEPDE